MMVSYGWDGPGCDEAASGWVSGFKTDDNGMIINVIDGRI
jgi:hypothetical protein